MPRWHHTAHLWPLVGMRSGGRRRDDLWRARISAGTSIAYTSSSFSALSRSSSRTVRRNSISSLARRSRPQGPLPCSDRAPADPYDQGRPRGGASRPRSEPLRPPSPQRPGAMSAMHLLHDRPEHRRIRGSVRRSLPFPLTSPAPDVPSHVDGRPFLRRAGDLPPTAS